MKKKIKFIWPLLFLLLTPGLSFASNNVTIHYTGAPGPLFNITNLAPGDISKKTLTVANNTAVNQSFKLQIIANQPPSALSDAIELKIINNATKAEAYSGTFASVLSQKEISLGTLAPGTPVNYELIATMNKAAGNSLMGLTERFNITVGFESNASPNASVAWFASNLGFTKTSTPIVITETPIVADSNTVNEPEVKGNSIAQIMSTHGSGCFWWWVVALILIGQLTIIERYVQGLKHGNPIRKYYFIWPLILGIIGWCLHYFLQGSHSPSWFCDHYWLVLLLIVFLGEAAFASLLSTKKH